MQALILILTIIILVAIFSVQNAVPVSISLFFWKFEASLAIVIYLLVLLGMVLGMIFIYWIRLKSSLNKAAIKKE